MGLNKRSRIKHMLLFFGLPVIGSVAGNAVYEHLITPAIPFLPKVLSLCTAYSLPRSPYCSC